MNPIRRTKQFIKNFWYEFYTYLWLPTLGRRALRKHLVTRKDRGYPECTECGQCCTGCICWDRESRLCKVWNQTQTIGCRDYPFHPKAIAPSVKGICRYYWGEEHPIPSREEIKRRIEERMIKYEI